MKDKVIDAAVILLSLLCLLMAFFWACLYPESPISKLLFFLIYVFAGIWGSVFAAKAVKKFTQRKNDE